MEIRAMMGDITQQETDAIIVNLFEEVTTPGGATGSVDKALDGVISELINDGEIKGKRGRMTLIHTLGKMTPSRVLVAGLGKKSEFSTDVVRSVSSECFRYLRRVGVESVATVAHGAGIGKLGSMDSGQAISEGSILGLYQFDKYKSLNNVQRKIKQLNIVEFDSSKIADLKAGIEKGRVIAQAVNLCRDMVNEPANFMTPTRMAEYASEVAQRSGLEIEVLDHSQMSDLGMGALLGVAQGSAEPPKFIILRYIGNSKSKAHILGLLGKGITFDSGGLDIKSATNMATMKGDMAGAASVISAMQAIGQLKPNINVTAIVAATENMPGSRAQRPGDIVRAMNGTTIEIDNTDAEGRLVLADAISYARSIGLEKILDVATLTGAIVIALGKHTTGVFGNDQDFIDQVIQAGSRVGEKFWQFPMFKEYKNQYKSDFADIKNTGGRGAGSITGAQFIGEFCHGISWVHLDIAGTSSSDKVKGYTVKRATGVPVRTLVDLVQNIAKY